MLVQFTRLYSNSHQYNGCAELSYVAPRHHHCVHSGRVHSPYHSSNRPWPEEMYPPRPPLSAPPLGVTMENRIWFTYLFPIHIDETLIFSDTGDVRFAYVLSPQHTSLARAKWRKRLWKRSSIYRTVLSFVLFWMG